MLYEIRHLFIAADLQRGDSGEHRAPFLMGDTSYEMIVFDS